MTTTTTNTGKTATTLYRITNTDGRSGLAWDELYADAVDAETAIRDAMGWDTSVTSERYSVDGSMACSVYETEQERDSDADGAYAPRIVDVPVQVSRVSTDDDGQGAIEVSALVTAPGLMQGITRWTAIPHPDGRPGYEPSGDSIDAWTDAQLARVLPTDALVSVGLEILAIAGQAVPS